SYIDDIAGEMMDHLDEQVLRENTVVMFTTDRGAHLGENGFWGKIATMKQNNYEVSARVPLLINIPGVTAP
ncbi:hypothetical protein CAPTEDRAFT_87618, partial [Capitella teleta]